MPRADYQPNHSNLGGSNRLLSIDDVAERWGRPHSTVRNHWRRWGMPFFQIGRKWNIRERDLTRWEDEQKRKSGAA